MFVVLYLAEGLVAFSALAFEVIAARLLAPYVGMSTDSWTAIIAAFLLAMALGNRIGGSLAGKSDVRRMLRCSALAVAVGGLTVAVIPLLIEWCDAWILASAPSILWRSVLFTAVLCIPAGMFFGIATPLLMVSLLALAEGRGRAIGGMYAAGAAGSVAGVLAALWVLLDELGVRASLAMIGMLSLANAILIAAAAMRRRAHPVQA